MTDAEKRGALVFFGEGKCITCHATKGKSNEMFSDFENHVAGIPQLAPPFGVHTSNMIYDGPDEDQDFGAMQISAIPRTSTSSARRRSGTSALSPAFFHNGAFARLEDAIRFHLDPTQPYNPAAAGIDKDLTAPHGAAHRRVVLSIRCSRTAASSCRRRRFATSRSSSRPGCSTRARRKRTCAA